MAQKVDTGGLALDVAVNLTHDRCADARPTSYLTDRLVKARTRSCTKHKFRTSVPGCFIVVALLTGRQHRPKVHGLQRLSSVRRGYAGGTPVVQS